MSNKLLVTQSESSHYYQVNPDGSVEARYDAGLREARKQCYYVSPTTLWKATRANGSLANWLKDQLIRAFFTTPRRLNEEDKDYAQRLDTIAQSTGKEAAEFGTRVHDAIEHYPSIPTDQDVLWHFEQYRTWHEENITDIISSEKMIANKSIGVAGRCDRIAVHKKYGPVVIDIKTQNVKEGKKPQAWDSWAPQLAFYAKTEQLNGVLTETPYCINIVLDSNGKYKLTEFVWTPEEVEWAYLQFLATAWLWFAEKDYWPTGKWSPNFVLVNK